MADLSVIIPARNEEFLGNTIEDILLHREGNTNIVVILDGAWPVTPLPVHPDVHIIYHPESIGQRAATNEGAKFSSSKFLMKLDAHCSVDQGFDVKLMAQCQPDWTVIPRMYNLHVFNWKCQSCGNETYQGPKPVTCLDSKGRPGCNNTTDFERVIVWKPRTSRVTDFARFDSTLHFQYWGAYGARPETKGDIADLMCSVGACWFMHRERFWELGGLDERHGSWGQFGVEMACKAWLSGGRHVVNKTTWFAHLFRTQPGFGFPYELSGKAVEHARKHSRNLWVNGTWDKAIHPLSWLIKKFAPVPDWSDTDIAALDTPKSPTVITTPKGTLSKSIVFYTDNRLDDAVRLPVQKQLNKMGLPIISVSLAPLDFGEPNLVMDRERGYLTMFEQILAGIETANTDIVYLAEHDVLYHPTHFGFNPPKKDIFYYNENVWKVDLTSGKALFYYTKQTSGCFAYRDLLLQHYRTRVERVKKEGFTRTMGFEPGTHSFPRGIDNFKAERWMSAAPNIDIRHNYNLTSSRWKQDQFRNPRACLGWTEADEVPDWGRTKDQFSTLLRNISQTI